MKKHFEMRFGGTGGQGMMLMGDVTAEAAGIKEGKEILLTKSYGPESRGGACRSELIIDDEKIAYPVVSEPDVVLAMSQKACDSYTGDLAAGGIIIIDSDLVKSVPQRGRSVFSIPITRIAKEVTGKEISANVVALGAVAVLADVLDEEAMKEAVIERFPAKFTEANVQAFEAGAAAAEELVSGQAKKYA
ncbi:MAG: 2-oxoacid:acceptor oxidoreductase family protein [Eubacteriaceae bacterium]|jgi:2-oxoglutarate ferredoxin oxidoreductase subunit gamma|nr:2-oxoacid:acceptor oxidoreductase family protein [Eubacteriaceae bacterium]